MFNELRGRIEKFNSTKKGHRNHKKNQTEIKDILTEVNNLQGNNSSIVEAKNLNSDLECKKAKNTHSEQKEEKRSKKKMRVV